MTTNCPTIGQVLREERTKLDRALEREGMVPCGTLADMRRDGWNEGEKRYLWLGGFDRFGEINYIRADWWVVEGSGIGSHHWCCCPHDPVYRKA